MAQSGSTLRSWPRWDALLSCLALAVILALLLIWPGGLLDKADHAAYAVCHRIGGHSFSVGGRQLPLCARCSGTYLGALAGYLVLVARRRGHAVRLPAPRYMGVLALFFVAWGIDGANSYLTLFPGLPFLYQPYNLLRLITGTLEGLAISAILLPVLNIILWADPASALLPGNSDAVESAADAPSLVGWTDLVWLLAGGTLVIAAVSSEWPPLLYPLALVSGAMIVGLVGMLNTMALLSVLRRAGRARRWREVVAPLLAGAALAMLELTAIGLLRDYVTTRFGLPF